MEPPSFPFRSSKFDFRSMDANRVVESAGGDGILQGGKGNNGQLMGYGELIDLFESIQSVPSN